MYLESEIKRAEVRNIWLVIIHDDLERVWRSFFESYLFVYANGGHIPNEKEFLEFRSSYKEMFRIMIGEKQFQSFSNIFQGEDFFNIYIHDWFEKMFKKEFVKLIIDQSMINKEESPKA